VFTNIFCTQVLAEWLITLLGVRVMYLWRFCYCEFHYCQIQRGWCKLCNKSDGSWRFGEDRMRCVRCAATSAASSSQFTACIVFLIWCLVSRASTFELMSIPFSRDTVWQGVPVERFQCFQQPHPYVAHGSHITMHTILIIHRPPSFCRIRMQRTATAIQYDAAYTEHFHTLV